MKTMQNIKRFFSYFKRYPLHLLNSFINLTKTLKNEVPILYTDHIFGNIAYETRYKIGKMYKENIHLINLLRDFDQLRLLQSETKLSLMSDSFDLFFMTNFIRKLELNSVIEYGSGASTIAFADLLQKNIIDKFVSIESETIWQESTQTCVNKLIPGLDNKFKVNFS